MNLPVHHNAMVIEYDDFEKWFEQVSGKKLDIIRDLGREHGHYTYAELEITKYEDNFSEDWNQYKDKFMNDPEDTYFNTEVIEGYIEENGLLPIGKYIILVDW